MNISLTSELEEFVKTQVSSGHYASASEVIREALRHQVRQSTLEQVQQRLEHSRAEVATGNAQVANDAFFENKRQLIRSKYMDKASTE